MAWRDPSVKATAKACPWVVIAVIGDGYPIRAAWRSARVILGRVTFGENERFRTKGACSTVLWREGASGIICHCRPRQGEDKGRRLQQSMAID